MISSDDALSPEKDWRRTPRLAIAFITIWLLIQLVVPLSAVSGDAPPGRFVWRMFSTSEHPPEYSVFTPDANTPVDLAQITARLRADLPFDRFVPQHVCAVVDDAVRVSWDGGDYECPTP